jgi:methyltransferase (TIGR00027 family)
MNPISDTAFYTCAIRATDAVQPLSICGDNYAHFFMHEKGKTIAAKMKAPPRMSIGTVARHRIIDDLLREQISAWPDTTIIIIGCGFDTRAFRIPGGHWYEIDEPEVIEYKNAQLPVSDCSNVLQRISIAFSKERLETHLPAIPDSSPIAVVMEGVFYYLNNEQIDSTLLALRSAYPSHTLICDLMDRIAATQYSKEVRQDIESLGAKWIYVPNEPAQVFERSGYHSLETISTVEKVMTYRKTNSVIRILLRLMAPKLFKAFEIRVFEMAPV